MDNMLHREDITENVIAIKINRSYRAPMEKNRLYEATRGYWKLNRTRAEQAEYALSVYRGVIKEVYKIEAWLPAGTIPRSTLPDAELPEGRYEFVGEIAEERTREKYLGKSIAHLYRKGEANPIKYFLGHS